jgi:hypothetical protein
MSASKDPKKPYMIFNLGDDIEPLDKEVKVFSSEVIETAVVFTESYYQTEKGKLPVPDDYGFLVAFGLSRTEIEPLLKSKEFREALAKRGIFWPKNYDGTNAVALSVLSPQQQHCVLIVTDPTRSDSLRKRLELVGITYQTYRNWMKQPKFANAINTLSEDVLTDNLASVHMGMTAKAMAGDVTAARLVYELSGRHDPSKQQMVDLARIIGLVLESLTRHVTDSVVLNKLSQDLDVILSGDVPQIEATKPDFSFADPANIQDAVEVEQTVAEVLEDATATERDSENVPKGFFNI